MRQDFCYFVTIRFNSVKILISYMRAHRNKKIKNVKVSIVQINIDQINDQEFRSWLKEAAKRDCKWEMQYHRSFLSYALSFPSLSRSLRFARNDNRNYLCDEHLVRLFAFTIATSRTRNLYYVRMANYGYPPTAFTSWEPGNVRRFAEAVLSPFRFHPLPSSRVDSHPRISAINSPRILPARFLRASISFVRTRRKVYLLKFCTVCTVYYYRNS